jgi:serine phosphatase RsbU (regulator of sigma subunit)
MEIWGGIEPLERNVSTPGLDIWVLSEPFHGEEQGGDVYYVTLCGGGVTTRIVLADVSGHGSAVAEFSKSLRNILRKNINQKKQRAVVHGINQQFSEMAQFRRFATAIIATYLTSTDTLSICNAGHPRPLIYRASLSQWSFLPDELGESTGNLPLGLDEDTAYTNFEVKLVPGDLILFYTDAMIEAADPSGQLLGEQGLLTLATNLQPALKPSSMGRALIQSVARYRQNQPPDDDLTVIAIHHTAAPTPRMSVAQKLDVYAKVFGLKRI